MLKGDTGGTDGKGGRLSELNLSVGATVGSSSADARDFLLAQKDGLLATAFGEGGSTSLLSPFAPGPKSIGPRERPRIRRAAFFSVDAAGEKLDIVRILGEPDVLATGCSVDSAKATELTAVTGKVECGITWGSPKPNEACASANVVRPGGGVGGFVESEILPNPTPVSP
jgi:hypothetical protein